MKIVQQAKFRAALQKRILERLKEQGLSKLDRSSVVGDEDGESHNKSSQNVVTNSRLPNRQNMSNNAAGKRKRKKKGKKKKKQSVPENGQLGSLLVDPSKTNVLTTTCNTGGFNKEGDRASSKKKQRRKMLKGLLSKTRLDSYRV